MNWKFERDYLVCAEHPNYKIRENYYPGKSKIHKDYSLYFKSEVIATGALLYLKEIVDQRYGRIR